MPDSGPPYEWVGIDGVHYNTKTVTDSHLRFYHRMLVETQAQYVAEGAQQVVGSPQDAYCRRRIERMQARITPVEAELAARQLPAFAPRAPAQVTAAAERRRARATAPIVPAPIGPVPVTVAQATAPLFPPAAPAPRAYNTMSISTGDGGRPVPPAAPARDAYVVSVSTGNARRSVPPRARPAPPDPPSTGPAPVPLTSERMIRLPPRHTKE